jgi:DNA-directed RNA polymerase subunit RPC12/RpoP
MALINCHECGKQISDTAPACPGCGAPRRLTPEEKRSQEFIDVLKRANAGIPKCSLCGGILEKISGVEGLFRGGIAGVAKKHRCTMCGHLV